MRGFACADMLCPQIRKCTSHIRRFTYTNACAHPPKSSGLRRKPYSIPPLGVPKFFFCTRRAQFPFCHSMIDLEANKRGSRKPILIHRSTPPFRGSSTLGKSPKWCGAGVEREHRQSPLSHSTPVWGPPGPPPLFHTIIIYVPFTLFPGVPILERLTT